MTEPVEEHALEDGTTVKIYWDEDQQHADPRECDNLGTMVYFGSDYTWGDEQERDVGDRETYIREFCEDPENEVAVLVPIYFADYGSSGGRCYTTSPDSANGMIYVDRDDLRKEYGEDPDATSNARKLFETEVEVYDSYMQGEVYGFVIEDPDGEHQDSCWGFLGELSYCKSEAMEAAKHVQESHADELREKTRCQAMGVMTV